MARALNQVALMGTCILLLLQSSVQAESTLTRPSADKRFAAIDNSEIPDFQRHVIPLLGRLGCNGRNCHGSFQGRGDLRLSLFGYDFKMDYQALTANASSTDEKRVNSQAPQTSLMLQKPLMQVEHEGGRRFESDSWEHHLLRRWIEEGAKDIEQRRELSHLEIEPFEVIFRSDQKQKASTRIQLQVVAVWNDSYREDVTPLCRFRTNDDSVVTVDQEGWLTSTGAGDTHVIAFYDNGIASVPVIRPVESASTPLADTADGPDSIDKFVNAKLRKLGLVPSDICGDLEFLRRVSLDVTGTLPTPIEVETFREDQSLDKRQRKIAQLLQRPAYAAWWANKLCDFTGCNPNQQAELGQELSVQWYTWIFARIQENVPYNELVRRMVLAKGRESLDQSYVDYAANVSAYFHEDDPADFSARETMPHYWTRRNMQEPETAAQAFAHNFLGVRLQCAQCHKHPFAAWTQADFKEFGRFFESIQFGVRPNDLPNYRQMAKSVGLNLRGDKGTAIRDDVLRHARKGQTIPWRELYIQTRDSDQAIALLRSERVHIGPSGDPRLPIMNWMSSPDNPWFAQAFVNRVWAGYFHTGIIDPPDDLSPANPPSNPALLAWLTEQFVQRDFDMKWLHSEIVSSDAYQRSWKPSRNNSNDRHNFSRAIPRRMPAEVVYDSVKQALAADDMQTEVRQDLTRRAIGHLSMRLAGTYAMHVFGKPDRVVNCDCERDNQPTLLQSVFLQNDPLIDQRLEASGWIEGVQQTRTQADSEQLIRQAWLRVLSRPPSTDERARAEKHFEQGETVGDAMRDLLWALLNTKEFLLIK